jgi:hypothetical protein
MSQVSSHTPNHDLAVQEPDDADPTLAALAASRRTTWQRLARAAPAIGAVLLAVVVLLGSFPSVRSDAALLLFGATPTPTPAIPPGDGVYYFDTSLPDTVVMLDDQPVPLSSLGALRAVRLARGQHHLSWQAGPFPTQFCTVSVPSRAADTCPRMAADATGNSELPFARFLLLHETLLTLPSDQQHVLTAALQRAVANLSTTVQAGEVYWTDAQGITTASQPLRATLEVRPQLATTQSGASRLLRLCGITRSGGAVRSCRNVFSLEDCAALCVLPFSTSSGDFLALVPVMLSWEYRTTSARLVARDRSTSSDPTQPTSDSAYPALFRITWDGTRWHAALLSGPVLGAPIHVNYQQSIYYDDASDQQLDDDLACLPAMGAFYYGGNAQRDAETEVRFRSGPNPAEGCLVTVTTRDDQGNATTARFLMRFGVYLTVDADAQRMSPYPLPMAGAAAREIASDLEQYPGQIVSAPPLGLFG